MPLEAGDFIPELNANNPLGGDPKSEGDDHLRLIKRSVLGSFPAFVGNNATPKSVTLTEDQINDAALKSEAASISGLWTFSEIVTFERDDVRISMRDAVGNLDEKNWYFRVNGNQFQIVTATDAAPTSPVEQPFEIQRSGTDILKIVQRAGGNEVCAQVPRADGSLLVRDMGGTEKKGGFRNPTMTVEDGDYTFVQADEGAVIRKNSNTAQTYLVPPLEEFTAMTFINDSATDQTLDETGGANLVAMLGGAQSNAPFTIAGNSVVQLYWTSASGVRVWGNGIS